MSTRPISGQSIGQYLIGRLQDYGVGHVFGIPGDYVLSFYKMLCDSPIQTIGCTREDSQVSPPMRMHESTVWALCVLHIVSVA